MWLLKTDWLSALFGMSSRNQFYPCIVTHHIFASCMHFAHTLNETWYKAYTINWNSLNANGSNFVFCDKTLFFMILYFAIAYGIWDACGEVKVLCKQAKKHYLYWR